MRRLILSALLTGWLAAPCAAEIRVDLSAATPEEVAAIEFIMARFNVNIEKENEAITSRNEEIERANHNLAQQQALPEEFPEVVGQQPAPLVQLKLLHSKPQAFLYEVINELIANWVAETKVASQQGIVEKLREATPAQQEQIEAILTE